MDVFFGIFGDFDYELDGVYAFISSFLLIDIAYLLINFDLFGKELLLIAVGLVKEIDLLNLYLSVFRCDHRNTLDASK